MIKSLEQMEADRARKEAERLRSDVTPNQNGASPAPEPASDRGPDEPLPEERETVAAKPERRQQVQTSSQDIHRTPPHSEEAEQGVLGSILVSKGLAMPECIRRIAVDRFYIPAHATIYGAFFELWKAGKPIDLISFTQYLSDRGQLEAVGGASFVTELYSFVPTASNLTSYLDITHDKWLLRLAILKSTEIVRLAYEEQDDPGQVLTALHRASDEIRMASNAQLAGVEDFGFDDLLQFDSSADQNNLVGYRWLCRGFTCLWAAAAGAGKSSLCMQLAIYWGNGLPIFGMKPVRPLRSLIIQAENDLGDTGEQLQGVIKGISKGADLALDRPKHQALTKQNVIIKRVIASTGTKFCGVLESLIESVKPDFVWIDPLFAFAGCDLKDAKEAGEFLRLGIFPIAVRHGVCLHVIHHVGKPDKDSNMKAGWTDLDFQYLGFGSSEIQNAFRAVNVMLPVQGQEKKFRMILAKRGGRAGATDTDGEFSTNIYLAHSAKEDGICWVQIDKPDEDSKDRQYNSTDVLEQMSVLHGLKTGALQKHVMTETGMSRPTFYRIFNELKNDGKICLGLGGWITKPKERTTPEWT